MSVITSTPGQIQVIKRTGDVAAFDAEKIEQYRQMTIEELSDAGGNLRELSSWLTETDDQNLDFKQRILAALFMTLIMIKINFMPWSVLVGLLITHVVVLIDSVLWSIKNNK